MKSPKVLFYLKEEKANPKTGEAPIYARITVDGIRSNISINRSINPKRWKDTDKLQKARKPEDAEIVNYMHSIRSRIREIERELIDDKVPITAENIKIAYQGKSKNSKTLLQAIERHNTLLKGLVESQNAAEGTLERYEQTEKHLKEFMKWKYNKKDFPLQELDFDFIDSFDYYLRTQRKCNNNSTVKYAGNLHKIVRAVIKIGWLKFDPFAMYQGRVVEVAPDFLSEEEIETIRNKEFSTERLGIIRDIFVFAIYTGFAYSDTKKLTYADIHKHVDGKLWIFAKRQKTRVKENVLLLQPALELIEKYRSHPRCKATGSLFPVPTNQKTNAYLKEIADVCGIKKNLTFHTARHTFATSVMLSNGVSMETTMAALGHKRLTQTQHYARVLDSKVSEDMSKLNERLKEKQKRH